LLATNLLSRGLDIAGVTVVVNYNISTTREGLLDPSTYLHRVGRTARFGTNGKALSFVTNQEENRIKTLESYFNTKVEKTDVDESIDNNHFQNIEEDIKKEKEGESKLEKGKKKKVLRNNRRMKTIHASVKTSRLNIPKCM